MYAGWPAVRSHLTTTDDKMRRIVLLRLIDISSGMSREIKITRETDEGDQQQQPSPFPSPPRDALSRTDSSDYKYESEGANGDGKKAGQSKWGKVRERVEETTNGDDEDEEAATRSKWANATRAFKKAPKSARSFLGIDAGASQPGGIGAHNTRTLNNWNERTFRAMNRNLIFGGKLKKDALATYMGGLRPEHADEADPFLFYRTTGGNHTKMPSKVSVVNMVTKMLQKPKAATDETSMAEIPKESGLSPDQSTGGPMLRSAGVPRMDSDPNAENEEGCWDAFKCTGDRKVGVGFCDKFFDNFIDESKKDEYNQIIKEVPQHRPYFTYWITFVQIVICIVSLFAYGLAPIGFSYHMKKGLVISTTLEKQLISYPVKENFWIGPAAMDLVHLGAKYAPCMRNDSNIYKAILRDQQRERETACCVRNDKGGCVQTSKADCSEMLSTWHKWNSGLPELETNRTSGTVCGLNPDYCNDVRDANWPDDITKWPICSNPTRPADDSKAEHMHCEVIGRPCCIGIQGECLITTKEHCTLMRGYFHDNADLCAQVDCMQDACGMIDFLHPKSPDQVYRLFTSIFIHAGIIQLIITLVFNIFILRDVEKLAGCLRIAIIYVGSGIIGNLGSAIFLPYQAEVGPSGSQFGILACLFVEMFHMWGYYLSPWTTFLKLFACLLFFFVLGFLPMIDNYANIFGFLTGLLISTILFPNVNLKGICKRILIIGVCIGGIVVLIVGLIILFYVKPISQCNACKFLSCPFGVKYCLEMDFNITRLTQK